MASGAPLRQYATAQIEFMLQDSYPRSSRGVSGDDPEGGAGSGVLRQAARNRSPREAREVARQALWLRRARSTDPQANARRCRTAGAEGDGSAAPGEKPPRWSAERRASRVISAFTRVLTRYGTQGASQAPDTPRYGVSHGCLARTRTSLGAPPTPLSR